MSSSNPIEVCRIANGCTVCAIAHHVRVPDAKGKTLQYFLPVHGVSHRGSAPKGYLFASSDDMQQRMTANTLRQGAHWLLGFPNIPFTDQPQEYILVITEADELVPHKTSVSLCIKIRTPLHSGTDATGKARGKRVRDKWDDTEIAPQSPSAGSIVCSQQFFACGTYQNPQTVTGNLTLPGAQQAPVAAGPVILCPDSSDLWTLPFNNVPEADGYLLTVTANDPANPGVTPQYVNDLSVSSAACVSTAPSAPTTPPPPPPPPPSPPPPS